MTQELKFEPEAVKALRVMETTNKCVYLTWKAGAWKSTLVNYFIDKTKKKYVLLGTTGVSAEMIGWQTIHRFFALKPWKDWWYFSALTSELKEFIREVDIFIIDEVSMMRADLFDKIEKIMRFVTWVDEFMGWKQFVFVWDLFQLPPVPEREEDKREKYNNKYKWLFFFDWNRYLQEYFEIVQLRKVYRQTDIDFVDMLNRVRSWDGSPEVLNYFNQKYIAKQNIHPKSILIATTNKIANEYNREKLDEIPGELKRSKAYVSWEFPEEIYPNDMWVNFKKWARVMFTVNHKDWYYMNGTLGTIKEIYQSSVAIEKDDWSTVEVWRNQWVNSDWTDDLWNPIVLWTFTQYPFKVAFWITIHKCQWKSFDHVVVDLGWGAFADWQVYVAFSRARSFEWLQLLKKLNRKDVKTSIEVINFLKK